MIRRIWRRVWDADSGAGDAIRGFGLSSATKSRMTISVSKGSGSQVSVLCFEDFEVHAEAICLPNFATGEV